MSKLVVVSQFSQPHEAHLAKSKLEASDIPVFLEDEHTISMNWLYSNALGGVKLKVPEEHVEKALEILEADYSADLEEVFGESDQIYCPNCKSEKVVPHTSNKGSALMTAFFLGLPLIFCKHGLKCEDCGYFWQS